MAHDQWRKICQSIPTSGLRAKSRLVLANELTNQIQNQTSTFDEPLFAVRDLTKIVAEYLEDDPHTFKDWLAKFGVTGTRRYDGSRAVGHPLLMSTIDQFLVRALDAARFISDPETYVCKTAALHNDLIPTLNANRTPCSWLMRCLT